MHLGLTQQNDGVPQFLTPHFEVMHTLCLSNCWSHLDLRSIAAAALATAILEYGLWCQQTPQQESVGGKRESCSGFSLGGNGKQLHEASHDYMQAKMKHACERAVSTTCL